MKLYGSLENRLEENKKDSFIEVGTGCTKYSWSDREAYEVVAVKDQKHVTIRKYDHKLKGECYSNGWELISNPSNPEIEVCKRGNYWYTSSTCTLEDLEKYEEAYRNANNIELQLWFAHNGFDKETILKKGKQTKYHKINIRFGRADYYYDYEF